MLAQLARTTPTIASRRGRSSCCLVWMAASSRARKRLHRRLEQELPASLPNRAAGAARLPARRRAARSSRLLTPPPAASGASGAALDAHAVRGRRPRSRADATSRAAEDVERGLEAVDRRCCTRRRDAVSRRMWPAATRNDRADRGEADRSADLAARVHESRSNARVGAPRHSRGLAIVTGTKERPRPEPPSTNGTNRSEKEWPSTGTRVSRATEIVARPRSPAMRGHPDAHPSDEDAGTTFDMTTTDRAIATKATPALVRPSGGGRPGRRA